MSLDDLRERSRYATHLPRWLLTGARATPTHSVRRGIIPSAEEAAQQ
jgi:hypothetical protein